jgi:glycosyltransferase involved in cell wall biosynthesis
MKLLILASHPVQYHAPVFRGIAERLAAAGGDCLVVYLSDFSIRGYRDREFGTSFAWDEPLLAGYRSVVLNGGQTAQPSGFGDLDAPGFAELLAQERPDRVLVHTLNYRGAIAATVRARLRGIPCTLRVETNDVAVPRSRWKGVARSLLYRLLYGLFDSAVAIGSYSRDHLIRHGIRRDRVAVAYYCVPDRFAAILDEEKQTRRDRLRRELQIDRDRTVILFSGKLIPKKNPALILDAIATLPPDLQRRFAVLFLGAGQLEGVLRDRAAALPDVPIHFLGFKNQTELPPYYLAADALALLSQRAGETWGLVANEALQAGLPCVVTEAVGCHRDFANFPHFQTVPVNDAIATGQAFANLINLPRQFDRYRDLLEDFSVDRAVERITIALLKRSNHKRSNHPS